MQRNNLCNELRKKYSTLTNCGVAKVDHPNYKNLWFVVPPPPPTDFPRKLSFEALSKANRIINQLPTFDTTSAVDRAISYLFVRREALTSSRMEGTWSTIDDILTPVYLRNDIQQKSNTASVRGYAEGLEKTFRIVQQKQYKAFSLELVCQLHKMIVSKDPGFRYKVGKIRTVGEPGSIVTIGGLGNLGRSKYDPTPPQYVEKCLKEVMSWHQDSFLAEKGDAGLGLPLPLRMAIGHVHFEAVHPFPDGNGRVGRMLWPLQMIASNVTPLYLSGYIESERQSYGETLNFAQMKLNYGPFAEFLSEAFAASYKETEITRSELLKLPEVWRKRGRFRKHSAAHDTLNLLLQHPIVTANDLADLLDTTFQSASTALKHLEAAYIVRERTGKMKNKVYAAEEVIELLARPFLENPKRALETATELLRQKI